MHESECPLNPCKSQDHKMGTDAPDLARVVCGTAWGGQPGSDADRGEEAQTPTHADASTLD